MKNITLAVDDEVLSRVAFLANTRHMSVEDLLNQRVADIASLAPITLENPSHRQLVEASQRPLESYDSPREELHDREKSRAELYVHQKQKLLDLIDKTEGDMGTQGWSRMRAYEA
jgi:hypothetical protein